MYVHSYYCAWLGALRLLKKGEITVGNPVAVWYNNMLVFLLLLPFYTQREQ